MHKVKVVSGYVPLPVKHLNRAAYKALGDRMVSAIGSDKCRIFLDFPLDECWFAPIVEHHPEWGLADKGHYPERFRQPEDLMLSNIVQHQRTTWALLAVDEEPDIDVVVWLDYGILKQGDFTGKPVTEEALAAFIAKVEQMDLDTIPFPGIWPRGPISQKGEVNWRFCGSTHIWPVKFLPHIHFAYTDQLFHYADRNQTVPNDLPIWAAVEAENSLPFRWYAANHDVTQLTNFPEPITRLCRLANQYGTDKCNPAGYTPVYDRVLHGRVVDRVLEVGICAQRDIPNHRCGASLWMWANYFPGAHVDGIDIDPESMVNEGRIRSCVADQASSASLLQAWVHFGKHRYDLIVDDGSHNPIHQLVTMQTLLQFLSDDGVYVIEDIGNWQFPTTKPEDLIAQVPSGFRAEIYGGHPHQLVVIERV